MKNIIRTAIGFIVVVAIALAVASVASASTSCLNGKDKGTGSDVTMRASHVSCSVANNVTIKIGQHMVDKPAQTDFTVRFHGSWRTHVTVQSATRVRVVSRHGTQTINILVVLPSGNSS